VTLAVRPDEDLDRELAEVSDVLRRQPPMLRFEDLRKDVMPFAEARGYLTADDAFEYVS